MTILFDKKKKKNNVFLPSVQRKTIVRHCKYCCMILHNTIDFVKHPIQTRLKKSVAQKIWFNYFKKAKLYKCIKI